jgi:hypothetical protein
MVADLEQDKGSEYSLSVRREGEDASMGAEVAPSPWNSTWAQAIEEAKRLRETEERFSWMKDADVQMLHLGLEPYPWEQFAEEVAKTGEMEFQVIEQRGSAEEVLRANLPLEMNSIIGPTLVVRSRTIVTALKMVSGLRSAPQATARMFSMLAVALPEGAQVDLIISSDAVLAALGACADILSHEWDIDCDCQDTDWKNLMVLWKNKRFRAVARKVDEEGLDADNSPFLKLALDQVVQMVMDTIQGESLKLIDRVEPECSDQ